tara:strand:+ start:159 stop:1313 length:1155 start_codon:yes stop_codon:yes gene_type:complete
MEVSERIGSLDLIRGVAILGIPFMNIMSMAAPEVAYSVPGWYEGAGVADYAVYVVQSLLVESRFISLFSILFGVGLAIQADRFVRLGVNPRPMLRRRLGWLLLFGLAHGFLIWSGDVLALYAVTGFVVLHWVDWPVRRLVRVGVAFVLVGQLALGAAIAASLATGDNLMEVPTLPYSSVDLASLRATWTGTGRATANATAYAELLAAIPLTLFWHTAGLMAFGIALYRRGFFTDREAWRRVLPWSAGGAVAAAGVLWFRFRVGLDSSAAAATMSIMMIPGFLMALGYAAGLVRWADSERAPHLRTRLQTTGRMAFTVYLSQSVLLVGYFIAVAPQLWGALGRLQLWIIVLGVVMLQTVGARWWSRRFGQGPMERLWRRLAFGSS